ncbi:MAG: hypothetical protein P0Y56_02480 [Candidatus Andeanibacterium colombiense]|uniref:Elongation factor P n=1 Tax=Candidatus Andeanibacterium colombiense TaxID=3121345 RepID=A0AAJ6BN74_9SPHN|nr:MAG: hypothetical protein P0Y56_02480 [Sphingomonadaceae bacterium]
MQPLFKLLSLALLAGAAAASAQNSRLDTLERGNYACEMPGDAATQRGVAVPEQSFKVVNASTYVARGERGQYLRLGDTVTITSGPLKGNRYSMKSDHFLRQIDDKGMVTKLRCVKER